MGTDIHGWLQRRYGEGAWENLARVPSERYYLLFAALADVRNGSGFAGVYTHEPIRYIADPRGLPPDEAAKVKAAEAADGDDEASYLATDYGDHSQTWFTLAELLNWDGWDQPIRRGGFVDRAEYEACIAEGRTPKSWCGDISGRDIIKTTAEAVRAGTAPTGWTHVGMAWDAGKLIDCIGPFRQWMDYLRAEYAFELKVEDSYQKIRIVVGFDS